MSGQSVDLARNEAVPSNGSARARAAAAATPRAAAASRSQNLPARLLRLHPLCSLVVELGAPQRRHLTASASASAARAAATELSLEILRCRRRQRRPLARLRRSPPPQCAQPPRRRQRRRPRRRRPPPDMPSSRAAARRALAAASHGRAVAPPPGGISFDERHRRRRPRAPPTAFSRRRRGVAATRSPFNRPVAAAATSYRRFAAIAPHGASARAVRAASIAPRPPRRDAPLPCGAGRQGRHIAEAAAPRGAPPRALADGGAAASSGAKVDGRRIVPAVRSIGAAHAEWMRAMMPRGVAYGWRPIGRVLPVGTAAAPTAAGVGGARTTVAPRRRQQARGASWERRSACCVR